MSGRFSRNKGARFERAIANKLKPIFPKAVRGVGQTQSGANGSDVEGTPYWIECKAQKKTNIEGAFAQAQEAKDTAEDPRPIRVVSKRDREPTKVTLLFDDFLELLDPSTDKTLIDRLRSYKRETDLICNILGKLSEHHAQEMKHFAKILQGWIQIIGREKE